MIKLFEEKNKYITNTGTKKAPVYNVSSDEKLDLIISWDVCDFEKVTLNIEGNVNLLEFGEKYTAKMEINLKENSHLSHSIAYFGNDKISSYIVNIAENASYQGALADFTSGKNKFDYVCNLNGEGAEARWNLATLSKEKDNKDFTISFFHYAKHTFANMENYGVCENEAILNFLGTSSIIKGAKRSSTHQSAKIMVFDPKCKAKASPKLCIGENDVEASHASVVGQINENHIFYLTSRGIPEEEAKKLITLGYLKPILKFFEAYKDDEIFTQIENKIEGKN